MAIKPEGGGGLNGLAICGRTFKVAIKIWPRLLGHTIYICNDIMKTKDMCVRHSYYFNFFLFGQFDLRMTCRYS